MAKNIETTWNKFINWIKANIFFKTTPEEKKYIREKTMITDHNALRVMLIIIFILQLAMILYTLISEGFVIRDKRVWYMICYVSLALSLLIALPLVDYFCKKRNAKAYYIVVAIIVNIFFIWGIGITLIDSLRGANLSTYAYVSLALCVFIILEPWVYILDTIVYVTALNLCIVFIPDIRYYSSVLITSLSVAVLTCAGAIFNFTRRINSIRLEKEVNDLNDILKTNIHMDALTNIHNRRFLTDHIDDHISLGTNPSGVLMFDIDDFKEINDVYGHQTGDNVLAELGKCINKTIENIPNSYGVRYGGEEFLIFIQHTNVDSIKEVAETLRKMVEEMDIITIDGDTIHIHISVGCSLAKPGNTYTTIINRADNNLYIAKNNGKNQIAYQD